MKGALGAGIARHKRCLNRTVASMLDAHEKRCHAKQGLLRCFPGSLQSHMLYYLTGCLQKTLGNARQSSILWLLDAVEPRQPPTVRAKAVKALGVVVEADPDTLEQPEVQKAVEKALQVSSMVDLVAPRLGAEHEDVFGRVKGSAAKHYWDAV